MTNVETGNVHYINISFAVLNVEIGINIEVAVCIFLQMT